MLAAQLDEQLETEFAEVCHEVSGGNPFLLCELTRTLVAEAIHPTAAAVPQLRQLAPTGVRHTVRARLTPLPEEAKGLARALAIVGDDGDPPLVAALAGLPEARVPVAADALRSAAIFDATASLRFVHPLTRNAVYADVPAGERGQLHARAATLLRERNAAPEQIATHLVACVPRCDRETVETLVEAGRRALRSGAPRSAIVYLSRAHSEPPPDDLRAAVLSSLLTATIRAVDHVAFSSIEPDVLAELERDPRLRGQWATRLTTWLALNGRFDQAVELLKRAIEAAADVGDVDLAFRLEVQLGTVARLPPSTQLERLAPYRDRIPPGSATERLAAALDARFALTTGTAAEATEHARWALRDEAILANPPDLVTAGEVLLVLTIADAFDDADSGAERAVAIARARHATPELSNAWAVRSFVALARGDLSAAEADARQALALAREGALPVAVPPFAALLAMALTARGELAEAEAALRAGGVGAEAVPDTVWLASALLARGLLHAACDRWEEAAADLGELHARKLRWGLGASPFVQAGAFAAIALTATGERRRARELAEEELAHARRWGAPTAISTALLGLGTATEGPDGLALLQEAVTVLDGSPARLRRAVALTELGAALRRANRRADARAPLREGLDLARRCGAAGLARRARDELLATGERVRRATPIGAASLTPSERRVAELAASGLMNREIAQSLFLTVKTIETHLAATYDKLGIRSRRELPAALGARTGA